jgi:hypothetical protein
MGVRHSPISSRVQHYLAKAEVCSRWAEHAKDEHAKASFLECAEQWLELARQVEQLESGG